MGDSILRRYMEEVEAEVPQRGSSEEAFQANFKTLVP